MGERRFPAPWQVRVIAGGYVVEDASGRAVAYIYAAEGQRLSAMPQALSWDEARRIAAGIVRLPELLKPCQTFAMNRADNQLPPGSYPFADGYHPLEALAFAEAPPELEAFLKQVADAAGVIITRDRPVELLCRSPDLADQKFMVWWPSGHERLHVLTPKALIRGRA
jgi:hypothetical protein